MSITLVIREEAKDTREIELTPVCVTLRDSLRRPFGVLAWADVEGHYCYGIALCNPGYEGDADRWDAGHGQAVAISRMLFACPPEIMKHIERKSASRGWCYGAIKKGVGRPLEQVANHIFQMMKRRGHLEGPMAGRLITCLQTFSRTDWGYCVDDAPDAPDWDDDEKDEVDAAAQ